jgi:hypothetical protein
MLAQPFLQTKNFTLDFTNALFPIRNQELPRSSGLQLALYLGAVLSHHSTVALDLLPQVFVPPHEVEYNTPIAWH